MKVVFDVDRRRTVYLCLSERKQLGGQLMCFEPSQPLGIISGLEETFVKRYAVERTNKAEIRPEGQSQKTESCRENLWNEIQLKGPIRQKEIYS